MRIRSGVMVILGGFILSACGTVNNLMTDRKTHVEFYRVFDIAQTNKSFAEMLKIVSDGIGRGVANLQEERPIISQDNLPDKPKRFRLVEKQFTGNAGALMAMAGINGIKTVDCSGAIWIGRANRPHAATTQGINFTACLFPYKSGYALDFYAYYTEKSGFTINPVELGSRLGANLAGKPSEFLEKVIDETLNYIRKNVPEAQIQIAEAYPPYPGLPWEREAKK